MLQDIDSACQPAGVWPHAVFSGHAHNYQRYTRTINAYQIPYVVAGCGGHSPPSKDARDLSHSLHDRQHAHARKL